MCVKSTKHHTMKKNKSHAYPSSSLKIKLMLIKKYIMWTNSNSPQFMHHTLRKRTQSTYRNTHLLHSSGPVWVYSVGDVASVLDGSHHSPITWLNANLSYQIKNQESAEHTPPVRNTRRSGTVSSLFARCQWDLDLREAHHSYIPVHIVLHQPRGHRWTACLVQPSSGCL